MVYESYRKKMASASRCFPELGNKSITGIWQRELNINCGYHIVNAQLNLGHAITFLVSCLCLSCGDCTILRYCMDQAQRAEVCPRPSSWTGLHPLGLVFVFLTPEAVRMRQIWGPRQKRTTGTVTPWERRNWSKQKVSIRI